MEDEVASMELTASANPPSLSWNLAFVPKQIGLMCAEARALFLIVLNGNHRVATTLLARGLSVPYLWAIMERKKALKIPFTVDKDTKMENPFRIPMTSDCGKFKNQVSRHCRHCDLQIKNGGVLLGHHHVAKKLQETTSMEPCLILTDVLKSEEGRPYLEKIKQLCSPQKPGQKEHVQRKEEGFICKDRRAFQRMANHDNNRHVKPRSKQMTTSPPSLRSRLQRRSQNVDDADEERENDLADVATGQQLRGSCHFAEVVDCGLSVSWEPAKDKGSRDAVSPGSIKDTDVLHTWNRRKHNAESKCNETSKPKRQRLSVLRLSGETEREGPSSPTYLDLQEGAQDRRVGRSAPSHAGLGGNVEECPGVTSILLDGGEDGREEEPTSLNQSSEDVHLHNLDHSIVQFTVGANDPADVLLPGRLAKTNPSEPIVLSSDDEDGEKSCDVPQRCSRRVRTLVSVEDAAIQGKSPQEAKRQEELSDSEDTELLNVVVDDVPSVAVSLPSNDVSMVLAFSSFYCGVYYGKSHGDVMLTEQTLIIPLKDKSEHLEVVLVLERKELRRYSVWEQQELEAQDINFKCDEDPSPPTVLMLWVSQTAAAAAQLELLDLCFKQDETTNIEKASPFMILTLDHPLEGMQGALFRSLLDIDCLNSFRESVVSCDPEETNLLEDFQGPFLSLDDSIELIRRTGRDGHLLGLLGLEKMNEDQDGLLCDQVQNTPPLVQLEGNFQEKMEQEQEEEVDIETELQPEEEQREQEVKSPAAEEPTSVYTLCHRRTKGTYSISLCKPDSSWIKYRHQGLAYSLIQFPPPPSKGGITVTMEDLQCLDSGEFLNDVIIDFYLKYLLHKAAAAVTERCHIFSSFFFKQLTRRDNASEGNTKDVCQRQRRHQRVKTWTRHVDIFKKDFVFVPVNQEAHWYLVVICFPGMMEPKVEVWKCPEPDFQMGNSQTSELPDLKAPNDDADVAPTLNRCENMDTETGTTQDKPTESTKPGPVTCTEGTCQRKTVCKRPCILVMDSLKRSLHERVFKLLRDYLESEWEVRRGSSRDFGADQMQSSHCKVPLQDNSSDCGLYLLQYVESFLKDPVVHFDLPLHLERWFPRQQVRRKRDEIRDLVLNLYSRQQLDSKR